MMKPYDRFALVYDAIMDESLYDQWTAFTLRHLLKSPKTSHLLDLACGTGIQALQFVEAGFAVTGFDLSQEMLDIAKKRAQKAQKTVSFVQGDMRHLEQLSTYDVITCYSDSLCYLEDEVDLGDVFKEVHTHLQSDGLFFFDVHSTYQIDKIFPTYSHHENAEDFAMVWDSFSDEPPHSIVHELTFFLKEADGRFSRYDEVHEERTYDLLTYDVLLEQAGFSSFQVYADFEDKAPDKTSRRWFFVAKK